jgi:hypothetical protein
MKKFLIFIISVLALIQVYSLSVLTGVVLDLLGLGNWHNVAMSIFAAVVVSSKLKSFLEGKMDEKYTSDYDTIE